MTAGKWSSWGFWTKFEHKNLFVGLGFDYPEHATMYYQKEDPPEGYTGLGDTVYYSRNVGDKPTLKEESRYTNIRLQVP